MNHSPSANNNLAGSPVCSVHDIQGSEADKHEDEDHSCCMDVDSHDVERDIDCTDDVQEQTPSSTCEADTPDVESDISLGCEEGSVTRFLEAAACGVARVQHKPENNLHCTRAPTLLHTFSRLLRSLCHRMVHLKHHRPTRKRKSE